jgi:succinate dehydrogenase / fumarate reductase flavoprotein subunit
MRQVAAGKVKMFPRTRCSTSWSSTARPGHHRRNLVTGEIERHAADAVVLATGGYGNVFFLSTNAMGCNVTAAWRATRRGPISPTPATPRSTHLHPGARRPTRASSRS